MNGKQNLSRRWTKWLHNVLVGRKKGQALSLDDTGAFAPTAPTKITFQKVQKSKKPCVEWRAQHRQQGNNYSTLYRQLRNEHFQTTIGSYRHNPRALWKTINHVMGRSAHHLPPALPLPDLPNHFSSLLYQPQ